MRYKPDHKEETRARIIETASREFREKGFEGVGIATLMKKLELTHGGFYAHFENKDDLVREAINNSFDEVDGMIADTLESGGINGLIELYLSPGHIDNAGLGCPVPAFANQVGRQSDSSASLFSERLNQRIRMFADEMQGQSISEKVSLATFIFSTLVGAVTLARSTHDPAERAKILDSTRSRLEKMVQT